MAKKYSEIADFTRQVFRSKTIGRILFNRQVHRHCAGLSGVVLDLASGGSSSYDAYLPDTIEILKTDSLVRHGTTVCVDFNKPLPFPDGNFETILFFNALYIAEDRVGTLREVHRVLKKGGALYLSMPFLYSEIPEPVDYCRLTYQGLEKELQEAGFADIEIVRFGERFTAAANLLHPFFIFNAVRFVAYGLGLFLDRIIPVNVKRQHPAPLGYFCIVKK